MDGQNQTPPYKQAWEEIQDIRSTLPTVRYRIGVLHAPAPDDPFFDSRDIAEGKALELSSKDNLPYGVWEIYTDTGHATTLAIAWEGVLWQE